jgi:hypothetical protein
MTDAGAAVGMDRLPWLEDEPAPRAQPKVREPKTPKAPRPRGTSASLRELAGWVVAAALLVAGVSYWLGTQSADQTPAPSRPEATVTLPEARSDPDASPPIVEAPEVRPAPLPTVSAPKPTVRRERQAATGRRKLSPMEMRDSDLAKTVSEQEGASAQAAAKPEAVKAAPPKVAAVPAVRPLASREQLRYWPARVSRGASGRLVQIGAFGSRQQAKLGWRRMKRAYPAVGRLQAVVVEARNSRGRRFYRFQIGTTSQAHSEVLCQRMERIRFSCAVVGLPWKAKVER